VYARLALDPDRRVRASAHTTLGMVAARVGRLLGPHVRTVLGPWLCGRGDPVSDVARAASDAFAVCAHSGGVLVRIPLPVSKPVPVPVPVPAQAWWLRGWS
jgi:hypothetical protein